MKPTQVGRAHFETVKKRRARFLLPCSTRPRRVGIGIGKTSLLPDPPLADIPSLTHLGTKTLCLT